MLITTCDVIPGKQIEVLGLVRGNVVTAEYIRGEIMAQRTWPGGEIKSYTDMMSEGRNIAERRMIAEAQQLGTNAIICARYERSTFVMEAFQTQEMLAYGTAVRYL